ncbi:MarR family winged helix-turn-helix transcriptional regulator [Telmatospirillum siberiense]|uniref:MarR family transcriptional regulator n=1 Tax=Telmatospirillum siberiense TaxID=382514 RepID=A0A2N3PWN4_9PROT|nr:MarR family winged helix-turn-helix transcriptional regulator [Telmatospirillum siberiense]PKU24809.1 MarR family transcriptional regulator [Telmatospirillum siberiense]
MSASSIDTVETLESNVGRLLADVVAMLDRSIDVRAKKIGISGPQWVVLMRIASGAGGTAAELCRAIGYDSGSMTRMLDRLVNLDLIRRERCDRDRRVVRLFLTETGKKLYKDLRPIAVDVLGEHLEGFSHQEIGQLTGFLQRILRNGGGS